MTPLERAARVQRRNRFSGPLAPENRAHAILRVALDRDEIALTLCKTNCNAVFPDDCAARKWELRLADAVIAYLLGNAK
jgi:hypothetical protein